MSFFDEVDEPQSTQRAPRRPRGRRPTDQQAIVNRRIVAVVAIAIVIVLMALLINSCEGSQTRSALQDYNNAVYAKMQQSDATGAAVFRNLSSGEAKTNLTGLVQQLDSELGTARTTMNEAQQLSVPGQMSGAQRYVVLALRMRYDGISLIANNIESAMTRGTSKTGLEQIAQGTSAFYASDVIYKSYAIPAIVGAFQSAGLAVGSSTIYGGQFLNDLAWLNSADIATKIGAKSTTSGSQNQSGAGTYVVQAGDTLSTIAARANVSVATLEQLNPTISPNALQVGQKLRLH